jgi:hypothetical protein
MIKLHEVSHNREVWVKPDNIMSMRRYAHNRTSVYTIGQSFYVKESVEEILKMMKQYFALVG